MLVLISIIIYIIFVINAMCKRKEIFLYSNLHFWMNFIFFLSFQLFVNIFLKMFLKSIFYSIFAFSLNVIKLKFENYFMFIYFIFQKFNFWKHFSDLNIFNIFLKNIFYLVFHFFCIYLKISISILAKKAKFVIYFFFVLYHLFITFQ